MKVTALKNLIYDETFILSGESFNMKDSDVQSFTRRHWVTTGEAKPVLKTQPTIDGLPPLEAETSRSKKK